MSDNVKTTKTPITKLCADRISASVNKLVRAVQPLRHHGSMLYKLALIRSLDDNPPDNAITGGEDNDTDGGCKDEENRLPDDGENPGRRDPLNPENGGTADGPDDDWRTNWGERIERVRDLDLTDVTNWEDALAVLYHKLGGRYTPKSQETRRLNEQFDRLVEGYNGHGLDLVKEIVGRFHVIDTEIRERITVLRTNLQENFVKMSLTYAKRLKTRYMKSVSKFRTVSQSANATSDEVNQAEGYLQALNIGIPTVADQEWENMLKEQLDNELNSALRALQTLNVEGLLRRAEETSSGPYLKTIARDFNSLLLPRKRTHVRDGREITESRDKMIGDFPHLFIQPYARLSKLFDHHGFQRFNAVPMTVNYEPQYVLIDNRTLVRSILNFQYDENPEIIPIYWRVFCQGNEADEGLERLHNRVHTIKKRLRFRGGLAHISEVLQPRLDYYRAKYGDAWDPQFRRNDGLFRSVRSDGRMVHLIWDMNLNDTEESFHTLAEKDFRLDMDTIFRKLSSAYRVGDEEVRRNVAKYAERLVFWDFNKRDIFVARQFKKDKVVRLCYSQGQRNKALRYLKYKRRTEKRAVDEGINLVQGAMTENSRQSFDLEDFGRYVAAKNSRFETLKIHYRHPFGVRAKESRYNGHKQADDKLLELIKDKFDSDCIHIIGHWHDAGRTAKYQQPTVSIGVRNLLTSAGILWYLCDEYKTSSICPFCYSTLEKTDKIRLSSRPHQREKGRTENVHGEKLCVNEACHYTYQNRDNVATRNMYNNAVSWLTTGQGISQLCRSRMERSIPLKDHEYSVEFLPNEEVFYMGCNICTRANERCDCSGERRTGVSAFIRLMVKLTDRATLADGQTRVVSKATVFGQTAWRLVGLSDVPQAARTRFLQHPQQQFNMTGQPQIRIGSVSPPAYSNFSWVLQEFTSIGEAR